MGKRYFYIAVEYYDENGNRTSRRFVNDFTFGCIYSFTFDVNECKLFASLRSAKAYMKNFIPPTRAKVFYETCYI